MKLTENTCGFIKPVNLFRDTSGIKYETGRGYQSKVKVPIDINMVNPLGISAMGAIELLRRSW
jgi:hypothetical protein